jgi:homoserine kinase
VRITVRVPATSANLGPGFDCFGLALDLCNEVTVDTEAGPSVTWEGEGADELPTDGTDMVSRSIASTVDRIRSDRRLPNASIPVFALHGINRIPLARGLGSSAAAAVAGVQIARVLLGPDVPWGPEPPVGIHYASAIEGHNDNVAAATMGGFTITAGGTVHRFDPHPDVRVAVLVPRHLRLPTDEARAAVPDQIQRWQAVSNIGHASLMSIAITSRPSLISAAIQDMIHEEARFALLPETLRVARLLHDAAVTACLSGAGPSLLAFEVDDRDVPAELGEGWEVWRPGIRATGVEVVVDV